MNSSLLRVLRYTFAGMFVNEIILHDILFNGAYHPDS